MEVWNIGFIDILLTVFVALWQSGSGGYTYLYEPLWWVGMISSKFNRLFKCFVSMVAFLFSFFFIGLLLNVFLNAALLFVSLRQSNNKENYYKFLLTTVFYAAFFFFFWLDNFSFAYNARPHLP